MKRTSLLMVLLAVMTMGLVSCGKDKFKEAEMPEFSDMFSYLGKEMTAVEAEFESKGYELMWDLQGHRIAEIDAEDEFYREEYVFTLNEGTITRIEYSFTAWEGKGSDTKKHVLSLYEAEKQFRDQSGMTHYAGRIETDQEGNGTDYTDKDEFIAAVEDLDFDAYDDPYGLSRSTYSDINTEIGFYYNTVFYSVEYK